MLYFIYIFLFTALFLSLTALVFAINAFYTLLKVKVPYVATPKWAIETIIRQIPFKEGMVFYELGAGDARVSVALKKHFPRLQATAFELAWWPYFNAKHKIKNSRLGIDLKRENFYNLKLSEADIIFCFLIDSVMPRLEKKLLAELKPGSLVISYGFKFPNWPPKEVISNPDKPSGSKINVYQK